MTIDQKSIQVSVVTERLDKIASSLEEKGLVIEAECIDVISNSLEVAAKNAETSEEEKQDSE